MTQKHTHYHHFGKHCHRRSPILFTLFIFLFVTTFGCPCTGFASDAPKISISPTSLNFGNIRVGGTPELSTIITNTGTLDLTISRFEITGLNLAEFNQINTCETIPSGGSCTMTVTFSPTLPYASKSAIVNVYSNDPGKPVANMKSLIPRQSRGLTPGEQSSLKRPFPCFSLIRFRSGSLYPFETRPMWSGLLFSSRLW